MYRDLECQHHLVQERFDQRPDIPGLTPIGFERWVTLFIKAHPEAEFDRLQKAVLEMPISNPDDKKERFPKEISRRLFPNHEDLKIRYKIEDSISEHAAIEIPRRTSHENLPTRQDSPTHQNQAPADTSHQSQSHRPSVSFADQVHSSTVPASRLPSNLERERKPYSNISCESAIDDTNSPTIVPASSNNSPNPIERERKPYIAQPGGGRQYEEDLNRPPPVSVGSKGDRDTSRNRAESTVNLAGPKPSRSDSTARSRPISIPQTRPMDVPKPEVHHHRASSNAGGAASGNAPTYRRRSASFSRGTTNDYRRSESDTRGYPQPGLDHYPSSMPRGGGDTVLDESDTRRYFEKQARERAERVRREDEARHFGESPRRSEAPIATSTRRDPSHAPSDDEYHRSSTAGRGYEYQQPYGGPVYR